MDEQKNSHRFLVVLIIIIAIIAGLYFYSKENGAVSDTIKTSESLATTTESIVNNNNEQKMSTTTEKVLVTIKTNQGDINLELYTDKAPNTVANFVKLAKADFYNGVLFHRVIKGFMIQGGDPLSKEADWNLHGTGGPGYKFDDEQNELGLERGIIAMANSGPNTNGSQFFIMTAKETPQLQGYYTSFGRVIGDMSAVEKIESVKVNERDHPIEDMVITSVEVK